jgi:chemotaxis protein methyltransferase CheR
MKTLGVDADHYLALLETARGKAELSVLVEAVRVGETRFFRHRAHVDALVEIVVAAWVASGEKSPRVWSAGCATGEEPYTIALVLARTLPRGTRPTILATDLSEEALAIARRGAYAASVLEQVPEPYRAGFTVRGSTATIRPEIASLVTFERDNLAGPEQPRGFHLIWCRNVLIYFDPAARKRAVEKLVAALVPGGFLFVGYSESLRDANGLTPITVGDQVVWRKPENTPARPKPAKAAPVERPPSPPSRPVRPAGKRLSSIPPTKELFIAERDPSSLSSRISEALKTSGLRSVTVDLDAMAFLEDDVATTLRRAAAVTRASGVDLRLSATRESTQRWVRRHRLQGEEA